MPAVDALVTTTVVVAVLLIVVAIVVPPEAGRGIISTLSPAENPVELLTVNCSFLRTGYPSCGKCADQRNYVALSLTDQQCKVVGYPLSCTRVGQSH
jgi:flavoprotein